jgi:hypothetical protein
VNDVEPFDGFLSALSDAVEGAEARLGDAQAFVEATQAIERLLVDEWPAIEAEVRAGTVQPEDRQRLDEVLKAITTLETKTRARLVWSADFETHMRRAMDGYA